MAESLKILASGPWPREHVSVTISGSQSHTKQADAEINQFWETELAAARRENRILFNSPVLCLQKYEITDRGLALQLARSDYKTFLVTTLRHNGFFLRHFPDSIAPALGNSILLTCGTQALLGVRSRRVAAYPGHAHLIGGVLDCRSGEVEKTAGPGAQVLRDHLLAEIHEEVGLDAADLARPPQVLLLVQDTVLNQPELIWHGEISEQSMNQAMQPSDAEDRHEHERMLTLSIAAAAEKTDMPLTPAARRAITMLAGLRTGRR